MFNEIETVRCQRCLAVNRLEGKFCSRCSTPLFLINCSPAHRFEDQAADELHSEHLLERISTLENQLVRVNEVAEQALALALQLTATNNPLLTELAAKLRQADEVDESDLAGFHVEPAPPPRREKVVRRVRKTDSKTRVANPASRAEKPRRG